MEMNSVGDDWKGIICLKYVTVEAVQNYSFDIFICVLFSYKRYFPIFLVFLPESLLPISDVLNRISRIISIF